MLVLISFGLVLVATVLLVLGLLSGGGLGLIYASIACSIAAGIALVVATVIRRPGAETSARPAPSDGWARDQEAASVGYTSTMASPGEATAPVPVVPAPASYTPARRPAMATVGASPGADIGGADDDDFFPIEDYDDLSEAEILPLVPELYEDELDMVEDREQKTKERAAVLDRIAEVRRSMSDDGDGDVDGEVAMEIGADDDFFPIEDYDQLKVAEILPLLPELYPEELDLVERRERANKGRVSIINRLAELRDAAEVDDGSDDEELVELPEPVMVGDDVDDVEAGVADDDFFPIEDYDELTVGEILPLLPELYDDELDLVEDRERATKNRAVIVNRLAELRDGGEPEEAPEADDVTATMPAMDDVDDVEAGVADDDFFPIEDYDELTVGEILPLLPELYDDELDVVEDRERATKNRAVIVNRLAELRDAPGTEDDGAGVEAVPDDEGVWEVPDEGWDDRPADPEDDLEEEVFPIADYDRLRVSEIRRVLPELSEDELEEVRSAELRGLNRITILTAIDRELGVEAAAPAKRAPAKRAPAKRAPAKKASPRKATGRKAAGRKAPAKKAPAKKASARKATGRKAAATKKAPARKTPARKTPAKKAVAKKAAATRGAPAKKAGATKASAAKRTATRRS